MPTAPTIADYRTMIESARIAAIVQRLRDAGALKSVDYRGEKRMLDLSGKKTGDLSKPAK